jgi:exodeoxyribonuclease VII large subunit
VNLELPLAAGVDARPSSIRELVLLAKQHVDTLPVAWVEGEVAGFRRFDSGYWFFTLRDRHASISCVVWRDEARRARTPPADGTMIWARGHLDVSSKRGQLQFRVLRFLPAPEGGWHQLRLEQARAALAKDGLLDPARKRPLPPFPRRIGVVTSAEGAVWHDIVAVVRRRWPLCELVLVPARVQGEDAPRELREALALANREESLDVLILARGGGSQNDLAAFNEESVARAVANSRAPTISAVGHETDVTLTDLVADLRAATPSAAAEKAVPSRVEVARRIAEQGRHLERAVRRRVEFAATRTGWMVDKLHAAVDRRVTLARSLVAGALARMAASAGSLLARDTSRTGRLAAQLEALSPLRVLERGYSVARDGRGRVLRRAADLPPGTPFTLRLADGEVPARAEEPR